MVDLKLPCENRKVYISYAMCPALDPNSTGKVGSRFGINIVIYPTRDNIL